MDLGYSRKFTEGFSGGLALRYIHSDLTPWQNTADGQETTPGRSVAGDAGFYYQDEFVLGSMDGLWALGTSVSNAGTPVRYSRDADAVPIPTNLRMGGRFQLELENHRFSLISDFNKLLVPTPAVYNDSIFQETGVLTVERGMEDPGTLLPRMVQSFYDAPGVMGNDGDYSVFLEEIREVSLGVGFEYVGMDRYVARTGYFHEHATKGNRKYLTLGAGIRFSHFSLDISYLRLTNGQNRPLYNTIHISVGLEFGNRRNS